MAARNLIRQGLAGTEEGDAEQDEENGYVSDESLEFEHEYDELNEPNPEFHCIWLVEWC